MIDYNTLKIDDVDFWSGNNHNDGGMKIQWSANTGFGEVDFIKTSEGKFECYTEYMDCNEDRKFTNAILKLFADNLTIFK